MENFERNLPKLVGIQEIKNPNGQLIINGVQVEQKMQVIHCPDCGLVLFQFDHPAADRLSVMNWCRHNKAILEENNRYCPKCGQRIRFYTEEPIEAEIVEVVEELEEESKDEPEVEGESADVK